MLAEGKTQSGSGCATNSSQNVVDELDFATAFAGVGYSQVDAARLVAAALKINWSGFYEDIEIEKPLHTYGMDSLVAAELRYWMSRELKSTLNVFKIMGNISLEQLCWMITERSSYMRFLER
ncbi:hypothetical protein N7478_011033 [Penicillium angulare]|uniref:uncharacterized protein n=1 Tax=Penicillium angulare TaxID=116970 RepID=UPI0025412EEC|nr:uncharacterized protein N7478_011033 [Penicillium angulare]KAJ5263428.1 hypothetical protein N7478_011033 [Penicillium angulare]